MPLKSKAQHWFSRLLPYSMEGEQQLHILRHWVLERMNHPLVSQFVLLLKEEVQMMRLNEALCFKMASSSKVLPLVGHLVDQKYP